MEIEKTQLPELGDLRFNTGNTGRERLKGAAREFEALLTEVLLRSMRSSLQEPEGSDGGNSREIYEDLIYQQLARTISEKAGLGVTELLEKRLAADAASAASAAPAAEPSPANAQPAMPPPEAHPAAHEAPDSPDEEHRLGLPVSGTVTSQFGWRQNPLSGSRQFHRGVDIAAVAGTPILAADEGRVVFSGNSEQYGNVVIVEHSDGVRTLYAHLAEASVRQGDIIDRLQAVGKVGSTGRATGPHLHFEVLEKEHHVDPLSRI